MIPEMPALIPTNGFVQKDILDDSSQLHFPQSHQPSPHPPCQLSPSDDELHKDLDNQIQVIKQIQQILGMEKMKLKQDQQTLKEFCTMNARSKQIMELDLLHSLQNEWRIEQILGKEMTKLKSMVKELQAIKAKSKQAIESSLPRSSENENIPYKQLRIGSPISINRCVTNTIGKAADKTENEGIVSNSYSFISNPSEYLVGIPGRPTNQDRSKIQTYSDNKVSEDSGDDEENFRIFWAAVDAFDQEEIETEDELNSSTQQIY